MTMKIRIINEDDTKKARVDVWNKATTGKDVLANVREIEPNGEITEYLHATQYVCVSEMPE